MRCDLQRAKRWTTSSYFYSNTFFNYVNNIWLYYGCLYTILTLYVYGIRGDLFSVRHTLFQKILTTFTNLTFLKIFTIILTYGFKEIKFRTSNSFIICIKSLDERGSDLIYCKWYSSTKNCAHLNFKYLLLSFYLYTTRPNFNFYQIKYTCLMFILYHIRIPTSKIFYFKIRN